MPTIYETLRSRAARRARYRRTLAELRALPLDTRLDLGIDDRDIPRIAHRAIYGE